MSLVDRLDKVHYPFPYESIYNATIAAINSTGRMKIISADPNTGYITARAAVSMWSWGENITIQLNRIDDSNTNLEISSQPRMRLTLVDYGKNRRNINVILSQISAHLPR